MANLKRLFVLCVCVLAAFGAQAAYRVVTAELATYRATKAATAALWQFHQEQVGTRKNEKNETVPLSRADALAYVVSKELQAATPGGQ